MAAVGSAGAAPAAPASPAAADSRRSSAGGADAPTDLFVSYTWWPAAKAADGSDIMSGQRVAHALAGVLRGAGYSVWLDTDHMAAAAAGGGTDDAMRTAIARAGAVVICASAAYAVSYACRLEAEFARDAGKPLFWVK